MKIHDQSSVGRLQYQMEFSLSLTLFIHKSRQGSFPSASISKVSLVLSKSSLRFDDDIAGLVIVEKSEVSFSK